MDIPTREERDTQIRARHRGESQDSDATTKLTYALLTADGALGVVTSPLYQLHDLIDPEETGERGRDPMPAIHGLALYFSAAVGDERPLNLVANRLAAALDPDGGLGKYRGTVAFVCTELGDGMGRMVNISADQREELHPRHAEALAAVREWQRRRNAGAEAEGRG